MVTNQYLCRKQGKRKGNRREMGEGERGCEVSGRDEEEERCQKEAGGEEGGGMGRCGWREEIEE